MSSLDAVYDLEDDHDYKEQDHHKDQDANGVTAVHDFCKVHVFSLSPSRAIVRMRCARNSSVIHSSVATAMIRSNSDSGVAT